MTWKKLEDWEISVPSSKTVGILNKQGALIAAGALLLQGPDNHWLFEPVAGYPQYTEGFPAEGGTIPQCFYDNFLPFGPREERLKAAETLLGLLSPVEGLGKFKLFLKCPRCRGYKIREEWVENKDQFREEPGLQYVDLSYAGGLISFLRPDRGICTCH